MMRLTNIGLSALFVTALSACTQVSQQTVESDSSVQGESKVVAPYATTKPGANVSLDPVLPKTMVSGSFQPVQLRLRESYGSGQLSAKIETSSGLSLFGGSSAKSFDMSSSNEHIWDVDVKADSDGVYFLNVFVEAGGQSRAFSVQVNMGQISQKMLDEAMPQNGELTDGGKLRVLDATETIK